MNILGIYGLTDHDSSAALIMDGKIIAAVSEERFSRLKHDSCFPYRSIEYCLKEAGININEVNFISFGGDPRPGTIFPPRYLGRVLKAAAKAPNPVEWAYFYRWMRKITRNAERALRYEMGYKGVFRPIPHHASHAASAYLLSSNERAAVMTVDGTGERETATFWKGEGGNIEYLGGFGRPDSLGYLFNAVTRYLGFGDFDEYKVMGLSAYGEKGSESMLDGIVGLREKGAVTLNPFYFDVKADYVTGVSRRFVEKYGPNRQPGEPISIQHKNMARALQRTLEKALCHMARHLHDATRARSLCLGGGVALNSVAVGAILSETPFEKVFIDPAPDDSGTSLGSALFLLKDSKPRFVDSSGTMPFWGPGYTDRQVEKTLWKCKAEAAKHRKPAQMAAKLIAKGLVVGWFQGRMEYGQRALGNRSILADPRIPGMRGIVNSMVKNREEFRPFAPAVLQERAGEYFHIPQEEVPLMNIVVKAKEDKRRMIPAVVHVDGTARVQTVKKQDNPLFYDLISSFQRISGIPVVLNTSFNVRGEPIVCSPEDALRCFYSSGLDCLFLGSYLLTKKKVKPWRWTL
jgi:carbamoyltransferase